MNPHPTSKNYEEAVNAYYGQPNLDAKILAALQEVGKDVDALRREDLGDFDEFHLSGVEGTRALAGLAGLREGNHVLDVGCGLGGPARTLAAEFGCTVVGLEITEAFCRAAETLTLRVGMSSQVSFRQGNALALPFDDETFDVAWMQHLAMNIPDKHTLFQEASRVLKQGGTLALHTILAGEVRSIHYPVFWAVDPAIDFIEPDDAFRDAIAANGFEEVVWLDVTRREITWYQAAAARMAGSSPPPLSLALLTENATQKGKNTLRNLEEGRITVAQAVYRRGGSGG